MDLPKEIKSIENDNQIESINYDRREQTVNYQLCETHLIRYQYGEECPLCELEKQTIKPNF